MKMQLVYAINLILIFSCVLIVAKNDTESKLDTKLNQSIFAEGLSQNHEDEPKKRIYGRKGVNMSTNDTVNSQNENSILESTSHSSIESTTAASVSITVHKNISNTLNTTNNQTDHNTKAINPVISANLSSTVSNTPQLANTTTITPKSLSLNTTTTTKLISTTTHKPKKPEITYSEYDDLGIKNSEKNINYNVANEKSDELPKVEQDVDRTVIEEKRAANSYILYLGLVFALPTSFVLINIAFRRIKNYLEVRHYTRVDFLVDGMYVG